MLFEAKPEVVDRAKRNEEAVKLAEQISNFVNSGSRRGVSSEVFFGFNHDFTIPGDTVLVMVDGDVEPWAIDHSNGFEQLIRYLDKYGTGTVQILGRFKQDFFRGVTCPSHLVHPSVNKMLAQKPE